MVDMKNLIKFKAKYNKNLFWKNAFKNVSRKMSSILFRPQCNQAVSQLIKILKYAVLLHICQGKLEKV